MCSCLQIQTGQKKSERVFDQTKQAKEKVSLKPDSTACLKDDRESAAIHSDNPNQATCIKVTSLDSQTCRGKESDVNLEFQTDDEIHGQMHIEDENKSLKNKIQDQDNQIESLKSELGRCLHEMNIMQAKLNAKKEIKTEELEQKDSSYFVQCKKQIFLIIIIMLGTLLSKIKKISNISNK